MALDKSPDMEGLTPAERAALYKQRASAAGIGRPPNQSAAAPDEAAAAVPAPVAPAAAPAAAAAPTAVAATPPPAVAAPPPKAEPEPPPPPKDPEVLAPLRALSADVTWKWRHGYAEVTLPREQLLPAARVVYAAGYDYLSLITEVDWKDRLELLYHVFSYDVKRQPVGVILRTDLPRDGFPSIASVTPVWPGAEYLERECHEMMGIRFLGHPDLRRILLPDDFVGFPMLKDYETDFDYVTVKHLVRELEAGFQ